MPDGGVGVVDNELQNVVALSNMDAEPITQGRVRLSDSSFAELAVWRVPRSLGGSGHSFKYRLAYVENGKCVIRYDNEAGKGDHKHFGRRESPYAFQSVEQLMRDFWADVENWRTRK